MFRIQLSAVKCGSVNVIKGLGDFSTLEELKPNFEPICRQCMDDMGYSKFHLEVTPLPIIFRATLYGKDNLQPQYFSAVFETDDFEGVYVFDVIEI